VPLFGLGLIYLLETEILLAELSEDVSDRAILIANAVNSQPNIWQDPEQAASFVSGIEYSVQGRIFLLGPEGNILASNDPELADHIGNSAGTELELEGINTALGGESSILGFYEINQQRSEALIPVTDINKQLIGIVGVTDSLEGVSTEFGQLRWLVMIALLVEILLAVAIALFLASRLARPITSVTESVTEIALGQRIEPVAEEGPLEIRQLAASVNILAERLHTLEDTRRRLLANLVHELGRPLGAIRAAIHTMRQGAAEDPQIREELLAGMEDEVIRMQPLLDDLAQLHGQVLGTLELNREPTALSEWLPSILLPWRAAVLEKGIRWQATIPAGLPTVDLDPGRMAQVVGNLLSNAIKYTPADGSVQVTAGADQEKYWFRVADSGPGIVPEEQEKVFEPFFRSTQQRRFPQGLGLGLTIARDLVEAHGGTLEVESDPENGSEFTARLPIN
jgi:signal transduction histidine kinase